MNIWNKKMPSQSERCDRCGKVLLKTHTGEISDHMAIYQEATGERLCPDCLANLINSLAGTSEEKKTLPPMATLDGRPCVFFFFSNDAPQVPQHNLENVARQVFGSERTGSAIFMTCRLPRGAIEEQRQAMFKHLMFWQHMQSDEKDVLFDQKTIQHPKVEFTIVFGYHGSNR